MNNKIHWKMTKKPKLIANVCNKRGLSLLVAVIICSLIIVAATGVTKVILSQFRDTDAYGTSLQTYYASESGLATALLMLRDKPIGYNIPEGKFEMAVDNNRKAQVKYSVQNNTMALNNARFSDYSKADSLFTVPSPWTGDAGQGTGFDFGAVATAGGSPGSCSLDDPPVPADGTIKEIKDKITAAALEHPCNWNKIYFGETVTVPLYRLKANNIDAINPAAVAGDTAFGGGMGMFVFRVRTPCKVWNEADDDGFVCAERWEFYNVVDTAKNRVKTDDTIINWEISGYDKDGDIVTMLPQNLRVNALNKEPDRIEEKNSEVYEKKINEAKKNAPPSTKPSLDLYMEKYTVLKDKNNLSSCGFGLFDNTSKCSGKDVKDYIGGIFEFLNADRFQQIPARSPSDIPTDKDWKRTIDEPYFKFTTIYPFYTDKDQTIRIPYLEYQIITDKPIAGNLQIIDVSATVGGFRQSLQVKKPVQSSVLEFAVHN